METKFTNHLITSIRIISWLIPIVISVFALKTAMEAKDDARKIYLLDIWPELQIQTSLNPIKNHASGFTVKNRGPVKAVQLKIALIAYRYQNGSGRESSSFVIGSDQQYELKELASNERKVFTISDSVASNARFQKPEHFNVLEIRLSYRRESDMNKQTKSAYYFINPEGKWVSENDSSLTPKIYDPIKNEILSRSQGADWSISIMEGHRSDPLHLIETERK
jgi:hypothetical protein